ncbi:rRNA pseudouridine synthase [Geopseudomonas guangdongensis]|uniref:Dual-specificity RNA pseudouridine synthase RluF n=1 Tax=Geopseudomonas guangdongensis TaxID=1245526 RepID=A0A1H2GXM8_9GAMM|nr:rRNA pseudouridine synthase [Pseudomonas guangdongensis]SDU24342.1 23S rRNA pseudouridine2604 synthase [Pseudomonas guangdongensis]
MSDPVRLSKRLAELLPCSRREAELYIEGGWVSVDGQTVEEPQFKVQPGQDVVLLPGARAESQPPLTLILHKPAGVSVEQAQALLGAATRSTDDASGQRLLKRHLQRLSTPLALENSASGLLVMTQNWGVIRKLTDDFSKIEQEYIVEVDGSLSEEQLKRLQFGLSYRGRPLTPCKVSWQSETRLRFALKAPQPGQLQHMCQAVGLQVQGIRRIRIGRLAMAKLPAGQWRYLGAHERF